MTARILPPDHESIHKGKPPKAKLAHRVKGRLGVYACAIPGISLTNYSVGPEGKGWGPHCAGAHTTITLSNGVRITVRSEIAELATLVMNRCLTQGYMIRQADTGAYNCRYISGTTIWSNHAWALAIDINWQSNPQHRPLITDIPVWMRQLFNRFGFAWGGDYTGSSVPDAMHFEFMGTPAQAASALLLARKELGATVVPPVGPPPLQDSRPTPLGAFPLAFGHWFGLKTDPNPKSHGGMIPEDRPPIMHIQEWLHYKGYFGAVARTSVVDGDYGTRTAKAVADWQGLVAPGTSFWGSIWSDDWARLDD